WRSRSHSKLAATASRSRCHSRFQVRGAMRSGLCRTTTSSSPTPTWAWSSPTSPRHVHARLRLRAPSRVHAYLGLRLHGFGEVQPNARGGHSLRRARFCLLGAEFLWRFPDTVPRKQPGAAFVVRNG